jgi:hypothetical protein
MREKKKKKEEQTTTDIENVKMRSTVDCQNKYTYISICLRVERK